MKSRFPVSAKSIYKKNMSELSLVYVRLPLNSNENSLTGTILESKLIEWRVYERINSALCGFSLLIIMLIGVVLNSYLGYGNIRQERLGDLDHCRAEILFASCDIDISSRVRVVVTVIEGIREPPCSRATANLSCRVRLFYGS